MKFTYTLTPESRNQLWKETGKMPPLTDIVSIDDQTATPEQRQQFLSLQEALKHMTLLFMILDRVPVGLLRVSDLGSISAAPLEAVPTIEQIWEIVTQMLDSLPRVQEQSALKRAEQEQRKAELKVWGERRNADLRARAEALRLERERMAAAAVERARNIVWDENGRAVIDLLDCLFILSEDEQDDRFNNWAKDVIGIGEQENGYGFLGDFVPRGTIEIERRYRVYLVASTSGSRKNNRTIYRVVLMDEDGQLQRTDITTSNQTPGWALRLRDPIKALLTE